MFGSKKRNLERASEETLQYIHAIVSPFTKSNMYIDASISDPYICGYIFTIIMRMSSTKALIHNLSKSDAEVILKDVMNRIFVGRCFMFEKSVEKWKNINDFKNGARHANDFEDFRLGMKRIDKNENYGEMLSIGKANDSNAKDELSAIYGHMDLFLYQPMNSFSQSHQEK